MSRIKDSATDQAQRQSQRKGILIGVGADGPIRIPWDFVRTHILRTRRCGNSGFRLTELLLLGGCVERPIVILDGRAELAGDCLAALRIKQMKEVQPTDEDQEQT